MKNDNIKGAVLGLERKLDAFKDKIRYQQLLAQSLAVEFESLTSEFESLKQLSGASSYQTESTSKQFDATSNHIESSSEQTGALSYKGESISEHFDASSFQSESTSFDFESLSEQISASSYQIESTSPHFESSSEQIDASSSLRELALLIRRSGKEKKIYFGQPNIPNRLAQILLALGERKKLSVAKMRRITGASRNTLVRDVKILKLLGWLEFHGSRKNGYFTLTDSVPDVIFRKGSG